MQDERPVPGMPPLHRQPLRGRDARHDGEWVPEIGPTPLHQHYLVLSAVALVCGAAAIVLIAAGVHLGHPIVKLCIVVGAPLLLVMTTDAGIRIWRSAWAWMAVDRRRGFLRLAWLAAVLVVYVVAVTISWLVLTA
jgi:hypothetical protein